VKQIKDWLLRSYYGAVILGSLVGIGFGLSMIIIVSVTGVAHAGNVKTLTLSERNVEGKERICVYSDAQRTETITQRVSEKCKAVATVDVE